MKFEEWLAQQDDVIEVECGCVTTEAFYHWMRVAYEAGNSPVVPDDVSIFEAAIEECKTCDSIDEHAWNHGVLAVIAKYESCRAAMLKAGNSPALTVWYGDMPETNGKTNWTAILHRKGECLSTGITIDRSEYPDRVRYEADRMRCLIGDLEYEPDILEYDSDAHSGYVPPTAAPGNSPAIPDGYVMVPKEPTEEMLQASYREASVYSPTAYRAMIAAAPQEVSDA